MKKQILRFAQEDGARTIAVPASKKLVPALAEPEYFLQYVAMIGGMVACIGWRSAVEERRCVDVGASGVGQQVAHLVEGNHLHALGRRELIGIGVLRQKDGILHEFGPDR